VQLYLQFGHGMKKLSRELLDAWSGGGVFLSPRDLDQGQLEQVADAARKAGAEPLLDPQCYVHDADHHRLTEHDYWRKYKAHSTSSLLTGTGCGEVCHELGKLNRHLGVSRHIVPGLLAQPVDRDWLALHEQLIGAARQELGDDALLATIALSAEVVRDEEQIEAVVEHAADWPVAGFYVVAETPGYLVDDPVWLANLLILVSGLKLLGKEVLVGYGNHQLLALAAANADVVASGNFLNVRAFSSGKFYMPAEDDISRRSVWYYCPQALSEYSLPFLDIAQRNGVLDLMKPDPVLGSTYADALFAGPQPSSVGWREPLPFHHYLTCLHGQCEQVAASSFDAALQKQNELLDSAEQLNKQLRKEGVFAKQRDFGPMFDVNRAALITLEKARGPRLRREWKPAGR
jgi:hypothetical protein